jgi:hypothetical protein
MVSAITEVINLYEQRVRSMQKVPLYSHGRKLLRSDGAPNKSFFHGLFNDHSISEGYRLHSENDAMQIL